MTATTTESRRPLIDRQSKLLALFVVLVLGLGLVSVIELGKSAVSCKFHGGSFSNDFSPDFDIDRTDCRLAWRESPVLHLWGVRPYVGLSWK